MMQTSFRQVRLVIWIAAVCFLSLAGAARAQDSKPAPGWTFQVTPYLWLAGINGDVTTPRGNSASFDLSIGDVLSHLDGGLMLEGEARYRRWGILADFDYAKLSGDGSFGPLLGTPNVEVKEYLGTLDGGYRFVDMDSLKLDGLVGFRVMSIDTSLSFSGNILAPRSDNASATWADPLVAVRAIVPMGPRFFASGYADVGGGPDGDLTWEVWGGLGYSFDATFAAYAGYRYLAMNHDIKNVSLNINQGGPLIGLGIRF